MGKVSCALNSSIAPSLCLCPHPYTFVSTPSTRGSTFLIPSTFLCLCISCSIYWNALFSLIHLKFFLLILGEYYFHRIFFLSLFRTKHHHSVYKSLYTDILLWYLFLHTNVLCLYTCKLLEGGRCHLSLYSIAYTVTCMDEAWHTVAACPNVH